MLKAKGLRRHACVGQPGLGGRRATSTITIMVITMIIVMTRMTITTRYPMPGFGTATVQHLPETVLFHHTNPSVLGTLSAASPDLRPAPLCTWEADLGGLCVHGLPALRPGTVLADLFLGGRGKPAGRGGKGTGGWGWAALTGCHSHPQVSVALGMPPYTASVSRFCEPPPAPTTWS